MDFNQQITILKESMRASNTKKETKVKFISADKWRIIMRRCIQKMTKKNIYDNNLLYDMDLIVQSIKEEKFIEAALNIQPFRPEFEIKKKQSQDKKLKEQIQNVEEYDQQKYRTKLTNNPKLDYRGSIIKFKKSINEKINDSIHELKMSEKSKKSLVEELILYVTEEETLIKEFQAKYHPFRKIIEQYLFLLQNKYKNTIDHSQLINIQEIQEKLIIDVKLLTEFIVKSSEPYITIFKTNNQEEKMEFQVKMMTFIKQYIEKHEKLNLTIRKIMRMASRKSEIIKKLIKKMPDFVEIADFDINDVYKIQGCYIQSMNALIEFAQAYTSKVSLKKLKQFRKCLTRDVDQYYASHQEAPLNREISAQTQIEILKFILSKLKSFLSQIYAQLKYLQVVYGQQDMSFKYDDSSYMYAQVSVALQALELDYL